MVLYHNVKKIKGAADRNGDFNGTCEQGFKRCSCSHVLTRMYSSRMSTVRCSGRHWGGGVSAQGVGGVCLGEGCLLGGGVCQTPPVDRMTDTCKNITLLQLCCGR